jgi:hypothetical protein
VTRQEGRRKRKVNGRQVTWQEGRRKIQVNGRHATRQEGRSKRLKRHVNERHETRGWKAEVKERRRGRKAEVEAG